MKQSARMAHKQAADVQQERAAELVAAGDLAGAERALEDADEAREREDHT